MVSPEMRGDGGGYHALPSAMYSNEQAAERAVERLLAADFDRDAISVMLRDDGSERFYQHTAPADDTERRIGVGAGVGAVLGSMLGVAATIVPGGLLAIGPIAAAVAGGASGAMGGGLVGVLVDQGLEPDQARAVAGAMDPGTVMVAVGAESSDRAKEAQRLLTKEASHHVAARLDR